MKYNSIDMLLESLSTSGAKLALAPYYQKAAPPIQDYAEEYDANVERSNYLRSLRQNAEDGGEVYKQADKELSELVRTNRKLRLDFENKNKYETKLKSLGIEKYQVQGEVIEEEEYIPEEGEILLPEVEISALTDESYSKLTDAQKQVYDAFVTDDQGIEGGFYEGGISQYIPMESEAIRKKEGEKQLECYIGKMLYKL